MKIHTDKNFMWQFGIGWSYISSKDPYIIVYFAIWYIELDF